MLAARSSFPLRGALIGVIALLVGASPAAAEHKPVDSWGRAGVDYDTYRKDALQCGLKGYYADISQTEQARAFVDASRKMKAIDNSNLVSPSATPDEAMAQSVEQAARYDQVRTSIRPEKKIRELKQGMEQVVTDCLKQRGYEKFRLTEGQRKALSKLTKGSDERKQFLYKLASDPDVLDAQALPPKSA